MTSYKDDHFASDLTGAPDYRPPAAKLASTHKKFTPDFVNTSTDMVYVVQRILLSENYEGANFLFHGPSGTGKTEFGRYIAQQLLKPVMVVGIGDILFSRLGMSERVLTQIFHDAKMGGKVLIFDEADSVLYNRKDTQRQWERQLVNEFLKLLEQHTEPVICTTNLLEELDPAVLRRFLFKVEFRPLGGEQARRVFRHYFGIEAPDYMAQLPDLTLGDFGIVHKKAAVLGYLHDEKGLCQLFYEEALARHEVKVKRAARNKKSA